jgi:putative membrane protein
MLKTLAQLIMGAFAVMIAAFLLPGVHIPNFFTGLVVTAVLVLLNLFVKPLLVLLTIPVTLFSFGLFLLVINALIILLAAELVPAFTVDGFWHALWFSLVYSLVHTFLRAINKRLEARENRTKQQLF